MPPFIALVLSLGLILTLLVYERRMNRDVSGALWIPCLWMFFIGTRFPSQWLDMSTASLANPDQYLEGSPVDQAVFLVLYAAAFGVLIRRRVPWGSIMAANFWITVFFVYALLSVLWSDYPWTAFKRFTKVVEHLMMVLVVLTEAKPLQAMDALFRRFLVTSVTLSVLFLKYYPEFGRAFDNWSGQPFNTGVTTDKNALGHICLLGTVFYTSSLLARAHRDVGQAIRGRTLIDLGMLGALFWLLDVANAKTALVCSVLGIASIVILARTRLGRKPTAVFIGVVSLVILAAVLESAFNIREMGIEALDRNPTLTDRTYVWEDVLAVPNNVFVGTGFESFWLGPRVEVLWQKYWWHPNQAHNGYIETYINLGAMGVSLLLIMMAWGFFRSLQTLREGDAFGSVRFSLIIAIIIFNYTDATFKALHILYFTFLLMSVTTGHLFEPARAPQGNLGGEGPLRG
jgi:O-antigen ligase